MIDALITEFDKGLRTVFAQAPLDRPMPGAELPEAEMSAEDRRHAAALMRINHVGEICAQALYQGQALTSRDPAVRQAMQQAAHEETEHLAWTERRIAELGGRKSLLNPLWYLGALGIGVVAGRVSDAVNLGFLAETEHQVSLHLQDHLSRLPQQDARSIEVVRQMRDDEMRHARTAESMGAASLPPLAKNAMQAAANVMRAVAYRV